MAGSYRSATGYLASRLRICAIGRRYLRTLHAWRSAEVAARAARRRKRRMGRVTNDLSDEQWAALQAAWGGCAYCGATDKPLQRDCMLAISRGGRYTLDNVVPACLSCNTSKCGDEVTGWLRRKRLGERAFLIRHLELRAALASRFPAEPQVGLASVETTSD